MYSFTFQIVKTLYTVLLDFLIVYQKQYSYLEKSNSVFYMWGFFKLF